MISDEAYRDLEEAVGRENVTRQPAVLDCYAWQPFLNEDPERWVHRPAAVVLPASTGEVQDVVRTCGRHGLRFKALCTGWGVHAGPTCEGVVQIDLRRMDRILEIDEKNMYAVVEPGTSGAQLQAEAMKRGLNTHLVGAGPVASPLASATSMHGVGHDGIYMSYSARNVMGVEWVLPTGELLTLGAPGSTGEWHCGDGPGPSLRGIMRGSSGAFGGLGVFTKVALKLFNWPGPAELEVDGTVLDSRVELPDNMGFFMCIFHEEKPFADALYKIGEAEIGYLCVRTAPGSFALSLAPRLFKKLMNTTALRSFLYEALAYPFIIMLAGDSREEFGYQKAVLMEIVAEHRGIVNDLSLSPRLASLVSMNLIRGSLFPLAFRIGGTFTTSLDENDSLDSQLAWADLCADVKREWIDRGLILDDGAENPYFVPYENNMYAHCEVVQIYDGRRRESVEALTPIAFDSTLNAIERCMTPLSVFTPEVRRLISPLAGDFNTWQKKISGSLDPGEVADAGLYTEEKDFDYGRIGTEKKARLKRVTARFKWK